VEHFALRLQTQQGRAAGAAWQQVQRGQGGNNTGVREQCSCWVLKGMWCKSAAGVGRGGRPVAGAGMCKENKR
jgi:hypothetical protein